MIPPDDDPERDDPGADESEPGGSGDDDSEDEALEGDAPADEARDEAAPGDHDLDEDEPAEVEPPPAREPGYLWTFDEQEARLPEQFATHMDILDEMEAPEILDLDLGRADDYLLWAAAQSLEEQEWTSQAIDLLRRIDASKKTHPALCYPEIRLRLHDLLRERGDYEEALAILDRVERDDPERRETCRERRAEVLILTGRAAEGLALFESAARAIPDDPWVPLAAAWALVRSGDYEGAPAWIKRAEHAARRLEDEEEIQSVDTEVERLQTEARIRSERQKRVAAAAAAAAAAPNPGPAEGSAPAAESASAEGYVAAAGALPAAGTMPAEGPVPAQRAPVDAESIRQEILGLLDAEEVQLTRKPPRTEQEKSAAVARLATLHRRASSGWDDAVERHDDQAIAAFDDLQWEVVGVAERFALELPGVE